jgi:crossover junction endodeoxyribonuclease RusA
MLFAVMSYLLAVHYNIIAYGVKGAIWYNGGMEITLTLPVPPSVNRYWTYQRGRVYTSDEARAYKQEVALLCRHVEKLRGAVAMNISVYRPRKAGDLDNYLKVLLDALNGILYEDDSAIVEICCFRYDDAKNPRVVVLAFETNVV